MKKAFLLTTLILALLVISSISLISAKTLIAGKIYNYDYSDTIAGADVEVTCNGNVQTTTSLSDGTYTVTYLETGDFSCNNGNDLSVYAEKDGLSGSRTGTIHDDAFDEDWDLAIVNVPIIPEFGIVIGALTLVSAVGIFFFVRRK